MGRVFFNENDRYAAQWLRNLYPQAVVDERSIHDVQPTDLVGYERVHLFAGIAGWELALDWAGWTGPVWTGSCPCQPFSCVGKRRGEKDERHLWPEFYRLISERRPSAIFGEQVASQDGLEWLDGVSLDLEEIGYAFAAANLCAAGESSPHLRQRHFFVAYADCKRRNGKHALLRPKEGGRFSSAIPEAARRGEFGSSMDDANGGQQHWWSGPLQVGWNAIQGEVERGGRKYRAQ